jgi:hypothetical protein
MPILTPDQIAADTIADLRRQLAEARARADTHWQRWKPGDPRCEGCDNGLEKTWAYCPWCSRPTWTEAYVEAEAAFDAKRLASEACPAEGER